MLNHVHLSNYKCYDEASIPLKPITVLCGGNSSGKTAILKSLLLLKQSYEAVGDNRLLLNGDYTVNGSFREVLRNNNESDGNTMGISFSFQIDRESPSFRKLAKSMAMTSRKAQIEHFEFEANYLFQENSEFSQVGNVLSLTLDLRTVFSAESYYRGDYICSTIRMKLLPKHNDSRYRIELEHFPTPNYQKSNPGEYPFSWENHIFLEAICNFKGLRMTSLYQENLSKKTISVLPVLYTIFQILESEFEQIQYLGPLREEPHRVYQLTNIFRDIQCLPGRISNEHRYIYKPFIGEIFVKGNAVHLFSGYEVPHLEKALDSSRRD